MDVNEITALLKAGRYAELDSQLRTALKSQPVSGILWKALSVALTLQGADALQASQQAASLMPDDAEAQANLGNALLRGARFDEARIAYEHALALHPRAPEVCNNLGNALRALGRSEEALARYREAIERKPDFAEAHSNMGNALRGMGRPDEAATSYRRALAINPQYPEAWNNLGNALLDVGQPGEAVASYRRALHLRPDFAEAHNNLGNGLRRLGQLDEAAASYRRALALKPDFAGAHSNLGDTLRDLGQLAEAAASCTRATELAPDHASAHNSLGCVFLDSGRLDEAESSLRRALALEPRFADALINLALLLRQRGLAAEAEANCRAALEARPDAASAFILLAELRADDGDFAQAEAHFRRAAALEDSPEAWAGMAHLRKMTDADAAWAVQAQRVAQQGLPPRREVYLRFALGKYFDDIQDYPLAFANYRRAHDLKPGGADKYDRRRQSLAVDRLIESYDGAWARAIDSASSAASRPLSEAARPVFIVGMPRSGTTLAEQILASHPAVFGAGELPYWHDAARGLATAADSRASRTDAIARMGAEYQRMLRHVSRDAQRVVDKMPANFWCLGLIHEALPDARIIHLRRNPLDTCLSIYFQHFKKALPYADDLQDLAHYYRQYQRIMGHWKATLPVQTLLEVPYEGLVAEQAAWSQQMLQFIGLPWDPRCLDFHRTQRSVMTASKWQVRQKMNRASIERWKHYQPFIGPLLTLLQPP